MKLTGVLCVMEKRKKGREREREREREMGCFIGRRCYTNDSKQIVYICSRHCDWAQRATRVSRIKHRIAMNHNSSRTHHNKNRVGQLCV